MNSMSLIFCLCSFSYFLLTTDQHLSNQSACKESIPVQRVKKAKRTCTCKKHYRKINLAGFKSKGQTFILDKKLSGQKCYFRARRWDSFHWISAYFHNLFPGYKKGGQGLILKKNIMQIGPMKAILQFLKIRKVSTHLRVPQHPYIT